MTFFSFFFLVIDHKFRISPLFSLFRYISPRFSKIIISPYFDKFSPCFTQIHRLFTYFTCISFPPTFTMMHLCITQCTYWTPLDVILSSSHAKKVVYFLPEYLLCTE